jgi:hypothetical protein
VRRWRVFILLSIAILLGVANAAARPRPELPIVVSNADPQLADETREILKIAHDSMAAASGVRIEDTLRVTYVSRDQSFDSIAGGLFPDWGVGVAIAERNLIAVRSPRDYPIGDQLPTILRHELAHLHLDAMLDQSRPPRWMHEGYAQQFAHQWDIGDDWIVARAVFTGSSLPLSDIDGVNSFRDAKAKLAYVQSYLAMGYFLERYGYDGLMLFARTMRKGGSWDQAFTQATGANYSGFQQEFDTYLKDRFNWAVFLHDTALLWVLLTVVFILLYLIKRYRAARKMAGWKKQESIEDALYAPFDYPEQEPQRPPSDD